MLGRLISEVGSGKSRYYTYDTVGNRSKVIIDSTTTVSYNYDSAGRLISETSNNGSTSTTTTYAYDKNGNLISKTEGTKKTTYTFDVWGNMTSGAGATYTYNAQGLRISKTVSGKKTSFTLVGGAVWSDSTTKYLWGAELITNGSVYYVYNAHGDVIQLLNASGKLTKTYDYDAYGNELSRDLNDANPFRYCGEYYDTETGFIYLRARYYDPTLGRFISRDPHWNVGNMIYGDNPDEDNPIPEIGAIIQNGNLYVYCMNNPVSFIDDTGELAYPGEIHDAVIKHIISRSGEFGEKILYKEQRIYYNKNAKLSYGRADILCEDGRVWEVKPNSIFHVIRGDAQVRKYASGHWFKDTALKLKLGDAYITSGQFEHLSGETTYTVSYGYIGNGLIVYNYAVKDIPINPETVKIGVLVVVGAAVLITAAVAVSGGSLAPLYFLLV